MTNRIAIMALGANLPFDSLQPAQTLTSACDWLQKRGAQITEHSRFYRTPCFPEGAGPDFVNAAITVRWTGEATELLALAHECEAAFGRTRQARWSARTLDVDVIAIEQLVLPDLTRWKRWANLPLGEQAKTSPQEAIIPHPRAHERAFVLVPVADVAAEWRHPILKQSVQELLEALSDEERAAIQPI